MIKAFVFGKFLPFHKGHQAMINFALTKCDYLSVLICCSDKENIDGLIRQKWIKSTFKENCNLNIEILNYSEDQLPNTSESSMEVSKVWSKIFKEKYSDYSALITSEKYGDYVADYMQIEHISFDIKRTKYPISASKIKSDFFSNWQYLPNNVKPYFAKKVVILGTESTGKTTLTKKLAEYFSCNFVLEAGRDLIPNSNSFTIEDLRNVATVHANRIKKAIIGPSALTIIDTDINITISYARKLLGNDLILKNDIKEFNKSDLYLYLCNDAIFHQDGTRLEEEKRNLLDKSHREILMQNKIPIIEIAGDWDERFKLAIFHIKKLIDIN
jgi:HTH-type transcriptional regulator, transcriptional repressor of NAD biosynthesis genes